MTRVLIVDDKDENLYYLRALLRGHGFEVEEARHGAEALVIARSHPPDVVISDLLMPVMDGYTLLRYWKSDAALRGAPFIVYTATYTEEKDAKLARDLGADAFILKPSEPEHFLAQLTAVLERGAAAEAPRRPVADQDEILQVYSEALIRKLEEKSLQLEDANKRLGRSAMQLEMAGRLARLGGWWLDAGARHVVWSDEVARIHGEPEGTAPDVERAIEYYDERHRPMIRRAVERCFSEGTPWDIELELNARDGRHLNVRVIGEAVRDDMGRVTRIQGAFQDVTEMRRAQRERRDLALRLQQTLESISDAVLMLDRDWRVVYVNPMGEQLLQRRREALLGRNVWEEFPEAVGSTFQREYERAVRERVRVQLVEFFSPLHSWFDVTAYPMEDGLVIYFRDVTARRESERRLAQQATMLDKAQDAILVRGLDDTILYWNKSAERLYGWAAEEAVGRNAHELVNDNSTEYLQAKQELLQRGEWTGTLRQVARGGRRVVTECRWTLVRNDAGEPESVLAINTDVTDRRDLEQQFLRAQRLESIGTLAGGIAHDLNNVLAPVMMSLDLLRDLAGPPGHELVESLRSSVGRGADLVRQVLTFARGLDGRKERVDVRTVVREIETVLRDTFPKRIAIAVELPETATCVMGDPTQLHQVLMNLAVNARDAMAKGGELRISVTREDLSGPAAVQLRLAPGRYVRIAVADQGSGIAPDHQEIIFEPFFTTKDVGHGTGLGLSTVQSIVRGHDGAIHLESELGKGSVFTCWFPWVGQEDEQPSAPNAARRLPRGDGELILVVDDEPSIRTVAERILTRHGYRVVTAANGHEALVVYREKREELDAIITDVAMPGMDGPELIAALRAEGVSVPIIVASGYVTDEGAGRLLEAATEFFVSKPFSAETLLTTLRGVLVGR
ncbi:MAG: hybrid sensor histidine kinase/response regulator [Gemmatimonas sp.]|nr:hybrid sensor histidine kinase/response regulator [Gemmatimonas sp.]